MNYRPTLESPVTPVADFADRVAGQVLGPYDAAMAPSRHPEPDPQPESEPVVGPPDDAPVGFRPLTRDDFPLLASWFGAPHVEPWWQEPWGLDDLEARYGPGLDGTDPTEARIVTLGSQPIGLVIRYRIADNDDWRTTLEPTGAPLDAVRHRLPDRRTRAHRPGRRNPDDRVIHHRLLGPLPGLSGLCRGRP